MIFRIAVDVFVKLLKLRYWLCKDHIMANFPLQNFGGQ